MTDKRKWMVYAGAGLGVLLLIAAARGCHKAPKDSVKEISPAIGGIRTEVTSTATVQPQNRLEVKPPINGRIDSILVKEGEPVRKGQQLILMSSTERAALLDAARSRGPEELARWEEVIKPTPLISPIDGEVIVSQDEPGQVVTSSEAVMVLSDKLIVQAQVDETDIGAVRVGQEAAISLDAYPQIKVKGRVDHIYYESKTVNNVTIYQVDIVPETVPAVFRSGMTATVTITDKAKEDALLLPLEAVKRTKDGAFVMVRERRGKKPTERKVEIGMLDEKNVEIVSGISEQDRIVVTTKKYTPGAGGPSGTNPLMPMRRRPAR